MELNSYAKSDHCLEILRQGVMCRGDISLVTFSWDSAARLPLADFSRPHECVNFEKLNRWSGKNAVNAFEPGLLHHPVLGKSIVVLEFRSNIFQGIHFLQKRLQCIE